MDDPNLDWGNVLQTAVTTYGAVKIADAQAEAASRYQYPFGPTMTATGLQSPYYPQRNPVYSPFSGLGNMGALLMIGGGLIAVAFLMTRK